MFFGAGVVLLTVVQTLDTGGQAGLTGFLLGATAGMRLSEAVTIAVSAGLAGVVVFALRRRFALVCFDPSFAATTGVDVRRTDLMMIAVLLAVVVIGMQVAGLVLVWRHHHPAGRGPFWTDRVSTMTLLAAAFGAITAGSARPCRRPDPLSRPVR